MIESARRHSKNRKLFFFSSKIKKDVMSCFSFSLLLLLPCVTIANHGTPFLSKNKSCTRQLGGKEGAWKCATKTVPGRS